MKRQLTASPAANCRISIPISTVRYKKCLLLIPTASLFLIRKGTLPAKIFMKILLEATKDSFNYCNEMYLIACNSLILYDSRTFSD